MSARVSDLNGFITIEGNPISKEGVFEYLGREIGLTGDDADKVFQVYRPAEELSDPECINSFKLLPFINEHAMLGSEDNGMMPAEQKGIEGVIGETVYWDAPYLRGTLRILAESAKQAVSNGTKVELSPGYRCIYKNESGTFEGKPYQYTQRSIRGNHLARVPDGRTGPDLSVLDHMTVTIDSAIIKEAVMADEVTKDAEGSGGLDRIKALIDELKPLLAQQEEARAMLKELSAAMGKEDEVEGGMEGGEDEVVEKAEIMEKSEDMNKSEDEDMKKDEDKAMDKKAMDAALKKIDALEKQMAAMDANLVSSIADRDKLATNLSEFVGTFDSKGMTAQQVAEYGIKKLEIPCQKGNERIALDAWMHGRTPERKKTPMTFDSKPGYNVVENWGKK